MALYGVSFTVSYVAWDTTNNVGRTGDAANHTLRWIKDGTAAAPTNSPVEVDAANAPGVYKLTLTSTEAQATYGTLAGKSSTSGVSIMPVSVAFERLPNAAPGAPGGLPILDANGRIKADAEAISGSAAAADTLEANVANLDVAVSTRLAATAYTASPSAADIWSHATRTLTAFGFQVTVGTNNDKTGYSLTPAYDRAKTALATTEYTAPDNASISAIKAQTDKLQFDANNLVLAAATVDVGAVANAVWDEARSAHTTTGTYGAVAEWASSGSITAADIWAYSTRTLTSATNITSDGQAIDQSQLANLDATISSRVAASDARLNYLDAAISTRLAAAAYTAPDNASISAIKAQTDKLQFDANNLVLSNVTIDTGAIADAVWDELRSGHTTTGTFGAVSEWAGGNGGGITAADVWSYATRTLTSAAGITSDGQTIDQSRLANLDAAVSSRAATSDTRFNYLDAAVSSRLAAASYVSPDNTSIAAIKTQTDKLQFDTNNLLLSNATIDVDAVADAVWDELRSGHTTTGTFGAVSEWAGGSGGGITAADVWSYATRTLTSAAGITSDGNTIDQTKIANLDAAVSTRLSQADISTITTNVFSSTIETGITFKNLCQVLGAVIAGQITTAGTDTEVFKAINDGTTTRVTVSVDASGNRTNVTFNL